MAGYGNRLSACHSNIHIVAIDSATTGRMSLVLDRTIESTRLIENLQAWHRDAAWLQDFGLIGSGKERKSRRFIGAPAPVDIVKAVYGQDPNKKLLSAAINRILPVIRSILICLKSANASGYSPNKSLRSAVKFPLSHGTSRRLRERMIANACSSIFCSKNSFTVV
ncbi:MAG: hypothetical protein GX748_15655 [Lentisphaerae bacterium]|nr:hypothetical protein [Lentisphaerota bacterium]